MVPKSYCTTSCSACADRLVEIGEECGLLCTVGDRFNGQCHDRRLAGVVSLDELLASSPDARGDAQIKFHSVRSRDSTTLASIRSPRARSFVLLFAMTHILTIAGLCQTESSTF